MRLFKGAGPGSFWWGTDPRLNGGFSVSPGVVGPSSVLRHITVASHPSPFVSFTMSYAVACQYAMSGPGGWASQVSPGVVYEIDTDITPLKMIDPIAGLSSKGYAHSHDGDPDLILGIASRVLHGTVLTTPVKRIGTLPRPPSFQDDLVGLVNAIRDAEVLIEGVPQASIVAVHKVF